MTDVTLTRLSVLRVLASLYYVLNDWCDIN